MSDRQQNALHHCDRRERQQKSSLTWILLVLLAAAVTGCGSNQRDQQIDDLRLTVDYDISQPISMREPVLDALERLAELLAQEDYNQLRQMTHPGGLFFWSENGTEPLYHFMSLEQSGRVRDSRMPRNVWLGIIDRLSNGADTYQLAGIAHLVPPRPESNRAALRATLIVDPGQAVASMVERLWVGNEEAMTILVEDWPDFAFQVEHEWGGLLVLLHHEGGAKLTVSHIVARAYFER